MILMLQYLRGLSCIVGVKVICAAQAGQLMWRWWRRQRLLSFTLIEEA